MAAPLNVTLGHKAVVLVGPPGGAAVGYPVTQGTLTFSSDGQDVTESQLTTPSGYPAPAKRTQGGLRSMTFNIQAHVKSDVSPHATTPYGLREGNHINLVVWPHGVGFGPAPYSAAYALVETVEFTFNPKTGEPEMFTITGNNGLDDFVKPGDPV